VHRLSRQEQTGPPQYLHLREACNIAVADGKLKHTDLRLTQYRVNPAFEPKNESDHQLRALAARDPEAVVYNLSVYVECRGLPGGKIDFTGRVLHYAGQDEQGYLQFAASPEEAPVIHFGGPWQIALLSKHTLPTGEKPGDLMTMIGTPGRGPGTFASLSYSGLIAEGVHPTAVVEFPTPSSPPSQGGDKGEVKGTIKETFALKHRC